MGLADPVLPSEEFDDDDIVESIEENQDIANFQVELVSSMLVACRNPSGKTYYQILSVNDDASYDEIRTSYRSSLLIFHPDKIHGKCGIGDDEVHEDFVKIQKAWEVLSDSKLRARYDHELECARHASEIAEDVDLEEMTAENIDERTEFFYPCRCGDCFSVTSEELQEMGLLSDVGKEEGKLLEDIKAGKASVLLHCGSCSLKIKLMVRLCP
ncbi:DPH4-like protein [Nymphaea thermarum]|nr:DPH4-like protein [Nymphaea thermarum]